MNRFFAAALMILVLPAAVVSADDRDLWEGQFSQCSYNAIGSVLRYFYGNPGAVKDREVFERDTFRTPIEATGMGAYFGWGPWTSYMVESGRMTWNGRPINDLRAERFSLRPRRDPETRGRFIVVTYEKGERETLREKLLSKLRVGPVIIWTPYAAALDHGRVREWQHVATVHSTPDESKDVVLYGPYTHSVTLLLKENNKILVIDGSVKDGLYTVDADNIISTSAAMTAFVRIRRGNEKSILDRGLSGVKVDEFNVVFWNK